MSKNCPASCDACKRSLPSSGSQSKEGDRDGDGTDAVQSDQAASSNCAVSRLIK